MDLPEAHLLSYQKAAVDKLTRLKGCGGLFLSMGTGKTRVALELALNFHCRKVLVVSPLSTVGVWKREVALYLPLRGYSARVTDCTRGSIRERSQVLAKLPQNQGSGGNSHGSEVEPSPLTIVIVGYESYWREPLRSAVLRYEPHIIIYDEAHRLKSQRAKQAKFSHLLAGKVPLRLGLTGTPMPNGPEDLYSIYKALRPETFGTRWADFEARYIRRGGYLNYQIVGYNNLPELEAKVAATSFRITKDEALDLPEQVDVTVPIELEPKTLKIYDNLRRMALSEVEGLYNGKATSGLAISRTVLTSVLRLQQVTSGHIRTDDGRVIDISSEKLEALDDLLSDAVPQVKRVVIFCRFRRDVDRVAEVCSKYGVTQVLDGRTPPAAREALLKSFTDGSAPLLVAQVAVASLGIDLSCAHTAVFYSPDYSLSNYLQSRDRLHRLGQVNKCTFYHFIAEHTIDEKVMGSLEKKENLARSVLDLARARELFA